MCIFVGGGSIWFIHLKNNSYIQNQMDFAFKG
jgi:hypothetical protein